MKILKHDFGRFQVRVSSSKREKHAGEKSAERVCTKRSVESSACPVAGKCGGCVFQRVAYPEQLRRKQKLVEELLSGFGGNIHVITGMDNPYHYRNKIHASFERRRDGTILSGIYQEGTHRIVPVEQCQIEDETADKIVEDLRRMVKSFKLTLYDERTGEGLLRHVLIRRGYRTGQVMVVPVLTSVVMPSKNNFLKALRESHPEVATVVINVNNRDTSMVLGEKEIVAFGKGFIEDILCGKRFHISPRSFYQVNSVQTEKLYAKAVELAGLRGDEKVIDAYCGIGTIGIIAAQYAGEVLGIELNVDAVKDAAKNAKMNGIKNIAFCCGDAGEFMTQAAEDGSSADVVFMDPPRSGSDSAFLRSVLKLHPEKIVYISCCLQTLARDIKMLCGDGEYVLRDVCPFDMFPFTEHVETVVLMSRSRKTAK